MSRITQKGATGALALRAGGIFQQTTDANLATLVGTRYDLSDGREVVLVSNSAVAIATSGVLCQNPPLASDHQGLAVSAFTAYSSTNQTQGIVTVTNGASTAITANMYQGGFVLVDSGTGLGQTLRIASHPAAAINAACAITLEDSPNTALVAASSTVCLIPPVGSGVVINPTTPTNTPVGVTLYPLTASNYGFLVSKGVTALLSDSAVASVGEAIAASVTTAGACTIATATGGVVTSTVIGNTVQTAVSAKARGVFVNL